jgi:insertion element IS1 protein InsB
MVVRDTCPGCGSMPFKKNGHTHSGKQNHQCQACGRQCVASAEERLMADKQRTLVAHLLREHMSLRGICRVGGVSLTWLLHLMVERFAACPDHLHAQLPVRPTAMVIRRLEAEADELWSFVGKKANTPWLWIAMDAKTRQVMAFDVGDRSRKSREQLWAKIPAVYQPQAMFYTDGHEVYNGVIPPAQHTAMTKRARNTHHVERFNNTLRDRVSRLVRDTRSCSNKLTNHLGAIKYCICHDNLTKTPA